MSGREFGTRAGVDWDAVAAAGDFERYSTRQLADDWGVHHASVARAAKPRRCVACEECFPLADRECPRCGHLRGRPATVDEARPIRDIPDGHLVKGVSTMLGPEGEVKAQWIKTFADRDVVLARLQEQLDALPAILEPLRGAIEPMPFDEEVEHDLCAAYLWGDPHFGLYSWAEETGDAWDLDLAARAHVGAVASLVKGAAPARQALLVTVGDTFHGDDTKNATPQSGHVLDVDTRWPKVFRAVVRSLRTCVDLLLERHELVRVVVVPGNHDPHSSVGLTEALRLAYEREPRVEVDDSPMPIRWFRWGQTLLCFNHGDKIKMAKLPSVVAAYTDELRELWGKTKHTHIYTGHIHHERFVESNGCTVESLPTLAGRDAYASSHGYRSRRQMKLDVWHRHEGHVQTSVCGVARALDEDEVA